MFILLQTEILGPSLLYVCKSSSALKDKISALTKILWQALVEIPMNSGSSCGLDTFPLFCFYAKTCKHVRVRVACLRDCPSKLVCRALMRNANDPASNLGLHIFSPY